MLLSACSQGLSGVSPTQTALESASRTALGITVPAPVPTPLVSAAEVGKIQDGAQASPPAFVLPTIRPTTTKSFPPDETPTLEVQAPSKLSICDSPGEIQPGSFPSEITGERVDYRIYLPPCYGEDNRTYPAIYLFHGSFHNESHWDNLGIREAAESLINAGELPPLLIIMPDGGEIAQVSSGGPSSFEGLVISDLARFIEANYCAWPESAGRAVGGLSRGGYWALEIAFQNPQNFISVGGHSAALLDESAGSKYDPFVAAERANVDDLRIYLDAGRSDYVMPQLLELHETLLEAGRDHQWVVNEGSHQDSYWAAHLDEYLKWYTVPWLTERSFYPVCDSDSPDR